MRGSPGPGNCRDVAGIMNQKAGAGQPATHEPRKRMEQEFTPALQFAWNRAGRIAADAGRPEIEPLDLLRGLLAEAEGHAARRLGDAGFDLSSWQASYPADSDLSNNEVDEVMPAAPALRL